MHAVLSGKTDIATLQLTLGEVSVERFRKLISCQQGSGARKHAANISIQSVNITAIHSSIDHSPPPDQHSPSYSFAAATYEIKLGL